MKIFNWIHRKFHANVDYHSFSHIKEGVSQNEKNADAARSQNDTEALLDHVTFPDVHECWKDGLLLSISTFGFDPLKSYNNLNEYFVEQRDEDEDNDHKESPVKDDEEEQEEVINPLVVKVFEREFKKVLLSSLGSVGKPDLSTTVDADDDIDTPLLWFLESAELQTNHDSSGIDEIEQKKKKEKEGKRTTLADLFSAEAYDSGKSYSGIVDKPAAATDRLEKPRCRKKHGLSFRKKFISPQADEHSPPIRKLHQLIRRMVKKKIHPELETKVHGMNGPFEMGGGDAAAVPTESSFLLQGCKTRADV